MNTHTTAQRFAVTMVLAALLVLGLVPAALAQTQEGRGWERTSTATGSDEGGQVSQSSSFQAPVEGLRGWEATSNATRPTQTVDNDRPVSTPTPSPSPTLLYGAAIVAALAMTFAAARLIRPHGGRHGVA